MSLVLYLSIEIRRLTAVDISPRLRTPISIRRRNRVEKRAYSENSPNQPFAICAGSAWADRKQALCDHGGTMWRMNHLSIRKGIAVSGHYLCSLECPAVNLMGYLRALHLPCYVLLLVK